VPLESVNRLKAVASVSDVKELNTADRSGSIRLLPNYFYLTSINLTDPHFYFGHGIDYAKKLYPKILYRIPEEYNFGGLLPNYLYDYGLICFIFFLCFLKKNTLTSFFSFEFLIMIITFTNSNFNTQSFWWMLLIFFALKFYGKQMLITDGKNQ